MKIKQTREICAANFEGSIVVFDFRFYRSYILNDTASRIWNFCRKPKSPTQITKFIKNKYKISFFRASKDVNKFISDLKKINLITFCPQD